MGMNADKPKRWKKDIAQSVDFYNEWFLRFAPKAYRQTRQTTTAQVEAALKWTENLSDISPKLLREHPQVLQMLRMATAPPIARDRLIGLAGVSRNLVAINETREINIPVDVAIKGAKARPRDLPLLMEAKSAGDFTNVNKRRKEEAIKMTQLRGTYGKNVRYVLFLCGYFDSGYLGYEAAEGIDWVWEHRIDDLRKLGL